MEQLEYIDRTNTDSIKWDNLEAMYGSYDLMPLWVADMDFRAPVAVREALSHYASEGLYGYYMIPDSYYSAFINWEKSIHKLEIEREWIRFSPGVVSAFNWIIQFMTKESDAIIIQTPVYYPFINAVKDNNRKLITSPLKCDHGQYTIDYDDFEMKIVNNNVKLFILCSPHNPVGRVWDSEELTTMLSICKKHGVYVISDEIHQDLAFKKHIPSLSIKGYDDILFSLTAPSKTFNLAGLQNSIITIADDKLRKHWDDYTSRLHVTTGNAFGYIAATAAYIHGYEWLSQIKDAILENYVTLKEGLQEAFPKIEISPLEGTYLMWINLAPYVKPTEIKDFVQKKCKLAVDYGSWFGGDDYETYIRINLATHNDNIVVALKNLTNALS
ncbi:MAG: MalY/PatB family protein [Suipraeoptans sp.]